MGQAADDMLDGLTCQDCGEWMEDVLAGGGHFQVPGYPRTCAGCAGPAAPAERDKCGTRDSKCPTCKRKFRGAAGLAQHRRDIAH